MPSLDPFFDNDPLLAQILTSMGLLSCNEEDDDFNNDYAWAMEGEEINGERNAFDVFANEDDDL